MNRDYNFHQNCYRYTHGNPPSKEETHPCFFCGELLPLTTEECKKCGIMICSECGNCLCSISTAEYKALIKIHKTYCCHLDEYSGVISHINIASAKVRNLVLNCERTLSHCYRLQFPEKKFTKNNLAFYIRSLLYSTLLKIKHIRYLLRK